MWDPLCEVFCAEFYMGASVLQDVVPLWSKELCPPRAIKINCIAAGSRSHCSRSPCVMAYNVGSIRSLPSKVENAFKSFSP